MSKRVKILTVALACAAVIAAIGLAVVLTRPKTRRFTVVFKNGDAVLKTETVEEGKPATPPAENPVKPGVGKYEYDFSGWDADFDVVKSDLTVNALFLERLARFTITAVDAVTGETAAMSTLEYGSSFSKFGKRLDKDYDILSVTDADGNAATLRDVKSDLTLKIAPVDAEFSYTTENGVLKAAKVAGAAVPENLIIPSLHRGRLVGEVDANGFSDLPGVISVKIGYGITRLGKFAFSGCAALASVTIPDTVNYIGTYAFDSTALVLNAADGVVCADGWALDTKGVVSGVLEIPDGVRAIAEGAFEYLGEITGAVIPASVEKICGRAFYSCSRLANFVVEEGLSEIGEYAFYDCALTEIVLPDSVTVLGDSVFRGCRALTRAVIGAGTVRISKDMFSYCDKLVSIKVSEKNPVYKDIDGAIFSKDGKTLFVFPPGAGGVYAVPSGVTGIADGAFSDWDKLSELTLSDSVTDCDLSKLSGAALTAIYVDPENAVFKDIDGVVFSKDGSVLLRYPKGKSGIYAPPAGVKKIEAAAFIGCAGLTGIDIGPDIAEIGKEAFRLSNLTGELFIPDTLKKIGYGAFENCYNLTSVFIGAGATDLGVCTFSDCLGLETVYTDSPVAAAGLDAAYLLKYADAVYINFEIDVDSTDLNDAFLKSSDTLVRDGKVYNAWIRKTA